MGKQEEQGPEDKVVYVYIKDAEELIGRLIGREGRNIRTLTRLTETDIDLPDSHQGKKNRGHWIKVIGHPRDASLCAMAIHLLLKDGRITPTIIEEALRSVYSTRGTDEDLEYLESRIREPHRVSSSPGKFVC